MRTNIKTIIMANIARQASPQGTWPTDILTKLRLLAFVYYDFGLVFEDLFCPCPFLKTSCSSQCQT